VASLNDRDEDMAPAGSEKVDGGLVAESMRLVAVERKIKRQVGGYWRWSAARSLLLVPGSQIMPASNKSPPKLAAARTPLSAVLRAALGHRGVQVTVTLWVIGYLLVLWLANDAQIE
jgi:hypothetical protein